MASTPEPSSRWLQYSLRWLFGCVLVVCVLLGAGRWFYVSAILPSEIVAKLKARQDSVEYDGRSVVGVRLGVPFRSDKEAERYIELLHELPDLVEVKADTSIDNIDEIETTQFKVRADRHFAALIGGLKVRRVVVQTMLEGQQTAQVIAAKKEVTAVIYGVTPTVQQLSAVCQAQHVVDLTFHSELTVEHLHALATAKHLHKLSLECKLPYNELPALGQLPACDLSLSTAIQEFDFDNFLSDDDLRNFIAPLPNLTALRLHTKQPSDEALGALGRSPSLKWLWLSIDAASDKALAALAKSPRLELLDLHDVRVSDSGVARLADLPSIKLIDLRGTKVTETGLAPFARCKSLNVLFYSKHLDDKRTRQLLPNVKALRKDDRDWSS